MRKLLPLLLLLASSLSAQGVTLKNGDSVVVRVAAAPAAATGWSTDFETDQPMNPNWTHPGGTAMRDTAFAHGSRASLKLVTPAVIYQRASVVRMFPFTGGKHTAEMWFYLPLGFPDVSVELALEGWSGTRQHFASFEWTRDVQFKVLGWRKWVVCPTCGGWGGKWEPIPGAQGPLLAGQWHSLKVAVDFDKKEYLSLVIDGRVLDMKGQPYQESAVTTASGSFQVSILLWSQTATPVTAWVDDVRISE